MPEFLTVILISFFSTSRINLSGFVLLSSLILKLMSETLSWTSSRSSFRTIKSLLFLLLGINLLRSAKLALLASSSLLPGKLPFMLKSLDASCSFITSRGFICGTSSSTYYYYYYCIYRLFKKIYIIYYINIIKLIKILYS